MTDGDGFPYFIDAVSQRSGLPAEEAAVLARAVLQTLAERVTGDAPGDLVGHLPNEVDGYLSGPAPDAAGASGPASDAAGASGPASDAAGTALPAPDPAGALGPDAGADGLTSGVGLEVGGAGATPMEAGPTEFLRRVEQRAGVDPATARAGTGAVFATLRTAMTVREFQEMVARLPRDGGF
ncbi:DUF2267 domain-containing protein [Micromonospora saelicesensis]|uniref:Uncharacterized conserved protein (DUF2267) n=1 Tax=Micromonospora saelicesensis TaxID=285676 RepID=A0A1C4ZTZ2_9ACTN|nr:DUF2267 domain-containing protein [Micromonospora saelicesensis]SCF36462.1 Uncharacterized conserved protein (DUF2267) [Micromonospora saelicesensis]